MSTEPRRTLIHIPIAHSQGDMGNLGQRISGDPAHRRFALTLWAEIQQHVQALGLDWLKAKVYQDGLPDASPEVIGKILAEIQSANYDLLRWLTGQGAELVGTESPALLKEEYDHIQNIVMAKDAVAKLAARRAFAVRADALLAERDTYVARRIDETLSPDGTGLLFIGQSHHVIERLAADIAVRRLSFGRPGNAPTNIVTQTGEETSDEHRGGRWPGPLGR